MFRSGRFGFQRSLGAVDQQPPQIPIDPWTIAKEFYADTEVARRVHRYIEELGELAPKCMVTAWALIRSSLIERGKSIRDFYEKYAPLDLKDEAMVFSEAMTKNAESLEEETSWMMPIAPGWELPDDTTVPQPRQKEHGDLRGQIYVAGYLALLPYINATPYGNVIYWGGVGITEGSIQLIEWAQGPPAGRPSEEVAELGRINQLRTSWMQEQLRSIYRQARASHRIASTHADATRRIEAFFATDPSSEPVMPEIWDGSLSDVEPPGSSRKKNAGSTVLILVAVVAATVGVLSLMED